MWSVCACREPAPGSPLTRDPALGLRDGRDSKVSLEAARREDGVVIDRARRTVEEAATARERAVAAAMRD